MDVDFLSKFGERAIADLDPLRSKMRLGELTLGAQLLSRLSGERLRHKAPQFKKQTRVRY